MSLDETAQQRCARLLYCAVSPRDKPQCAQPGAFGDPGLLGAQLEPRRRRPCFWEHVPAWSNHPPRFEWRQNLRLGPPLSVFGCWCAQPQVYAVIRDCWAPCNCHPENAQYLEVASECGALDLMGSWLHANADSSAEYMCLQGSYDHRIRVLSVMKTSMQLPTHLSRIPPFPRADVWQGTDSAGVAHKVAEVCRWAWSGPSQQRANPISALGFALCQNGILYFGVWEGNRPFGTSAFFKQSAGVPGTSIV